ncbi:hypothetical protein RRU01S_15_01010 [Agrobacterium rubi TR3 = NBRC 13261]|uniref:Uncharacterized protein n=1 Tax=Agrobacterium rubi TR3 = NBRC 13261 TaxID=1368415 RepID=A0A081CWY0_9HYPH|nr:hypothetical protein [Agrobacterium rubi]MBP1878144.1 hypothetical protein [Agrobacterium rubi]GAK71176.1 hypothetical protein RRU01S_15_01010 [Agrobacterium rubi TR3 = NBRC 13261]
MKAERLSAAKDALGSLQEQPGFDLSDFQKWELADFSSRFGISTEDARKLCRETERHEVAVGFTRLKLWHDAILVNATMSAVEKVAALRVWSFVNHSHLYAWPSQDRLAKELGYSRGPNLGKALRRSFELGAYSPVPIRDLPIDLRDMAVKGSGRSMRGVAYRLNPVEKWAEEAAAFASLQKGDMFRGGTLEGSMAHHLNSELNHQLAAPASPYISVGESPLTFQPVDSSQYGNDGGKLYG